jgi:hypothetical protein
MEVIFKYSEEISISYAKWAGVLPGDKNCEAMEAKF